MPIVATRPSGMEYNGNGVLLIFSIEHGACKNELLHLYCENIRKYDFSRFFLINGEDH